ncbi:hypothetical protein D5086_027749 [Populus alba]|uniref:Uncharacterized protein n=1 Tax=Populus alba TaxID=43335 RepID=A0ACC4AWG0_POPAL
MSHILPQSNPKDVSSFTQNNGRQLDVNGTTASNANNGVLQNGNADNALSFASTVNVPNQTSHAAGVPMAPTSLLGMPNLPSTWAGGCTPPVSFCIKQGIHHSMTSHAPQSHAGHFSLNTSNVISPTVAESRDVKYDYERPVNGHNFHPDYLDVHISQGAEPILQSYHPQGNPRLCMLSCCNSMIEVTWSLLNLSRACKRISSQFSDALRLNTLEQTIENEVWLEDQALTEEQASSAASASLSETSVHSVNVSETTINKGTGAVASEAFISSDQTNVVTGGKTSDTPLLDERSLLACIVRTIPTGGRIRINSTLFLIEGDYIQLREGAQEMISATAAVAKVAAAAAAAASPYSSFLPSVAVTPMAQSHRLKKAPSIESKSSNDADFDRSGVSSTQSKDSVHGTANSIYSGKQQSRSAYMGVICSRMVLLL